MHRNIHDHFFTHRLEMLNSKNLHSNNSNTLLSQEQRSDEHRSSKINTKCLKATAKPLDSPIIQHLAAKLVKWPKNEIKESKR